MYKFIGEFKQLSAYDFSQLGGVNNKNPWYDGFVFIYSDRSVQLGDTYAKKEEVQKRVDILLKSGMIVEI